MKVTLLHASLSCVWWTIPRGGNIKVHAVDSRWPHATMCGRAIPDEAIVAHREIDSERLCGRCLASLRTYDGKYVRFESEAGAE